MERMRDLLAFFFAAMAMVSLLCAVYQAFNEHRWSAVTLGALFVASAIMFDPSRIVSISAWGVTAQLQTTLENAKDVVERLKRLAQANAAVTYMTLAWSGRMGTPTAAEKQKLLDEADAQLRALNVDNAERQKIAKPLVSLIGVDLYSIYSQVMDRFVFWVTQTQEQNRSKDSSPEAIAAHQKVSDAVAEWRKVNAGHSPYRNREFYGLDVYLTRDIPTAIMSETQKSAAQEFKSRCSRFLTDASRKAVTHRKRPPLSTATWVVITISGLLIEP
jgi:phage terminase large subunit GpA-like protein